MSDGVDDMCDGVGSGVGDDCAVMVLCGSVLSLGGLGAGSIGGVWGFILGDSTESINLITVQLFNTHECL